VERVFDVDVWVEKIRQQRELLSQALQKLSIVRKVFPSEANFILVRFSAASAVFNRLLERGVVVRNRSNEVLCNNCLRISVGSAPENSLLVAVLKEFELEYVERVKQEV
ncbi:MAG TPA: aminotransferase class I/II-fold pyridoxal phosphate-dependent enzyme, partial [Prolixibacteraceae bacterium]|nr:aminotransferase class I/II-fold pyridoxal phosphate-dependent enzyme [Prolixibacteraceae bacterium]